MGDEIRKRTHESPETSCEAFRKAFFGSAMVVGHEALTMAYRLKGHDMGWCPFCGARLPGNEAPLTFLGREIPIDGLVAGDLADTRSALAQEREENAALRKRVRELEAVADRTYRSPAESVREALGSIYRKMGQCDDPRCCPPDSPTVPHWTRDMLAYRGALGYAVPGWHNGKLSDGMEPVNGVAEAIRAQLTEAERVSDERRQVIEGLRKELDDITGELTLAESANESLKARARNLDLEIARLVGELSRYRIAVATVAHAISPLPADTAVPDAPPTPYRKWESDEEAG